MSDMSDQSESGAYRPAGWYYAQGDPPGTQRYWDGSAWQGDPQPMKPAAPQTAATSEGQSAGPAPDSSATYAWDTPPVSRSAPAVASGSSADVGGFLSTLFDTSFSRFITRRAISVVYILVMIAVGLMTLLFVLSGAAGGGVGVVFALIVAPLIGLVYLVMIRMTLEFFVNQFRQTELLESIAEKLGADSQSSP